MRLHIIDEKKESLRDTSYDNDNGKYMVDSQLQVCSFDEVKNCYVKNNIPFANPVPKSNDALFLGKRKASL